MMLNPANQLAFLLCIGPYVDPRDSGVMERLQKQSSALAVSKRIAVMQLSKSHYLGACHCAAGCASYIACGGKESK